MSEPKPKILWSDESLRAHVEAVEQDDRSWFDQGCPVCAEAFSRLGIRGKVRGEP